MALTIPLFQHFIVLQVFYVLFFPPSPNPLRPPLAFSCEPHNHLQSSNTPILHGPALRLSTLPPLFFAYSPFMGEALLSVKLFLLPAGVVLGLLFSATMMAGPVWAAQVSRAGGVGKGMAAAAGFAMGQAVWSALAACALFSVGTAYWRVDLWFRIGAMAVLAILLLNLVRAPRLQWLQLHQSPHRPLLYTLRATLRMPLRLSGYLALIVAVNLPLRVHGLSNALLFATGVFTGVVLWMGFFVLVAHFGRNVPESVCIRSLNKLRTLGVAVLIGLILICAGPLFMNTYARAFL